MNFIQWKNEFFIQILSLSIRIKSKTKRRKSWRKKIALWVYLWRAKANASSGRTTLQEIKAKNNNISFIRSILLRNAVEIRIKENRERKREKNQLFWDSAAFGMWCRYTLNAEPLWRPIYCTNDEKIFYFCFSIVLLFFRSLVSTAVNLHK